MSMRSSTGAVADLARLRYSTVFNDYEYGSLRIERGLLISSEKSHSPVTMTDKPSQ